MKRNSQDLKIRAAADQLLLLEIDIGERKTAGGIIVPDVEKPNKDRTLRCEVLSFGPGLLVSGPDGSQRVPIRDIIGHDVSVGSVVLISLYTHTHEIPDWRQRTGKRVKVRIVRAKEVLAVEE